MTEQRIHPERTCPEELEGLTVLAFMPSLHAEALGLHLYSDYKYEQVQVNGLLRFIVSLSNYSLAMTIRLILFLDFGNLSVTALLNSKEAEFRIQDLQISFPVNL